MSEELKQQQELIEKEIYDLAEQLGLSNDDCQPITDGVCSIDSYLKSHPKVMWILKEPWDDIEDGKPVGGYWSIPNDCFAVKDNIWSQRTWQPIIYIMYGYLHNMMWQDMNWIHDNKKMADVMKDIAYINVSKMPGYSRSTWSNINKCYNIWKPILDKQIEIYSPDVIICAGTFSHFKDDFKNVGLQQLNSAKSLINYFKSGNRIIIDTYHPLQTQIDRGSYIDSVIEVLNEYFPRE